MQMLGIPRTLFARIALILVAATPFGTETSCSLAQTSAEAAIATSVSLRTVGAPGMSLATQAFLAREAGSSTGNDKKLDDATREYRQRSEVVLLTKPPNEAAQDVLRETVRIRVLYERGRNVWAAQKETVDVAAQAGTVVAGGLAVLPTGGVTQTAAGVVTVAVGVGGWAANKYHDGLLQDFDDAYSQRLSELLTTAVDEARRKDAVLYSALVKLDKNSPPTVREEEGRIALQKLMPYGSAYFGEAFLRKLPESERAKVEGKMALLLADAVGRQKVMTDGELDGLKKNAADTQLALKALHHQVAKLDAEYAGKFEEIGAAQKELATSLEELKTHVAELDKQDSQDIGYMQKVMWSRMSSAEKVDALRNGFFRGMSDKDREAQIAKLERVANIEVTFAKAETGFAYASALGKLAANLKVSGIKIENLNKNIAYAQAGANLLKAVALGGNPLDVINAANALLGVGGPDPATQRHQDIMKALSQISAQLEEIDRKLEEVIARQIETLQAIRALSQQIAETTILLTREIDKVNTRLDFVAELLVKPHLNGLNACRVFQQTASAFGLKRNGFFPSYEARRDHHDKDQTNQLVVSRRFPACVTFLEENVTLLPDSMPPFAMRIDLFENGDPNGFQKVRWEPMHDLTYSYLRMEGKGRCASRLVAVLATFPQTFADPGLKNSLVCPPADLSNKEGVYFLPKSLGGAPLDGQRALENAVYFPLVREIGDQLTFFAPYYELMDPPSRGPEGRLLSEEGLQKRKPDQQVKGEQWLNAYRDIANIAMAQEAVYAGVPIASEAARLIIAKDYGRAIIKDIAERQPQVVVPDSDPCPRLKKPGDMHPGLDDVGRYALTVCMMRKNPYFRQNVMSALAREVSRGSSTYKYAYYSRSQLRGLMDGLWGQAAPIELAEVRDTNGRPTGEQTWKLALIHDQTSGEEGDKLKTFLFDMSPPWFVVTKDQYRAGAFAYSAQAYAVADYQETVLTRLVWFAKRGPAKLIAQGTKLRAETRDTEILRRAAWQVGDPLRLSLDYATNERTIEDADTESGTGK